MSKREVLDRCEWCGKLSRTASGWEQRVLTEDRYATLCARCCAQRMDNPCNSLLDMRPRAKQPSTTPEATNDDDQPDGEFRKWTAAELRALPDDACLLDEEGREWSPRLFGAIPRRTTYWERFECRAMSRGKMRDWVIVESAAQLSRLKLRRIR